MEEKFLPIGSVVKLKNGQKRLMITGFLQMEQDENGQKNIWDYSGCLYPEGMLTSEANYVFNHSQIEEVHFIGLVDEEEEEITEEEPAYSEARRLLAMLQYFEDMDDKLIPNNSLIREFIGGSIFE